MVSTSVVKQKDLKLEKIRELLGITQKQLAEELSMSERSIIRYENGEREPLFTIYQVKKLNNLLKRIGYSIEDLPDILHEQN